MDHFAEGEDLSCPKCKAPMLRRIRMDCMYDNCKRWTIVEGDPTFSNYNFYSRKNKQSVDIRNQAFYCSEHERTDNG